MVSLLVGALVWQFRLSRYVAGVYWLCVVLISVTGTLNSDNMVDNWGIPLVVSTIGFTTLLTASFVTWYRVEGTLSIHTVDNFRREVFYWAAILFTFALGTAADLFSEKVALGYFTVLVIFAGIIAVVALGYRLRVLGSISAFWASYVVSRPLGASLGDFMSQAKNASGLGLGTTVTSLVFLSATLVLVAVLAITKVDQPKAPPLER
jgi:uncharacterized membrane-anchored protein